MTFTLALALTLQSTLGKPQVVCRAPKDDEGYKEGCMDVGVALATHVYPDSIRCEDGACK